MMPPAAATQRLGAVRVRHVLAALLLTGCAGAQQAEISPRAGLSCVDDSIECINRRKVTLNHLVNDPSKAWIKEKPTAEAYASGVRLFAFKSKKKVLPCDELAIGKKEADGAKAALNGAGRLLTPAQVSRGSMLAAEVSRELASERRRRCKKA